MIPLTVPALGDEEVEACARVLRSGMLVQGAEVRAFEALLAARTDRAHAVAVSSGTAALELALRALEIGPGDEVLCPALTWPSPAHAILAVGAEPVLVDVDPAEWNAGEDDFARARGPRTRAAIVIEQFGNPARHDRIASALDGLPLIVDAACSLGATYQGRPCGSHAVIACTSFHPRKVLTTGEGGACLTDDPVLDAALRTLRNHGQAAPGQFVRASVNLRLTEMQAAIGCVQLGKLDAIVTRRRVLAARVKEALPGTAFQLPPVGGVANQQTLGILVGAPHAGSATRERLMGWLTDNGVQAGPLSYALPALPQLAASAAAATARGESLRHARDIAARGLALPLYPSMSEATCDALITALSRGLAI